MPDTTSEQRCEECGGTPVLKVERFTDPAPRWLCPKCAMAHLPIDPREPDCEEAADD